MYWVCRQVSQTVKSGWSSGIKFQVWTFFWSTTGVNDSDFCLKHKMRSYLVCQRMFAHFLPSALGYIGDSRSPQLSCCHRLLFTTFPPCILTTLCCQDTPAGRLTASQMLRSRSAAMVVLLYCDSEQQPVVKTPHWPRKHNVFKVSKPR